MSEKKFEGKIKIAKRFRKAARRNLPSPFQAQSQARPLIVHCCHHKVGTVWFKRVYSAVADRYGLRLHAGPQASLGSHDIFIQDHSRIAADQLRDFRGSHMIRDPRDVVVSAYFYHLRTTEAWVLEPKPAYDGLCYQEYLKQFDVEEGLLAEIRSSATEIRNMVNWNYRDPRFLEIRYEDLISSEADGFRNLFEHYGFAPVAVEKSVEIALGFSLGKVKHKLSHIRSGQPNEWTKHFGDKHRALFKELTNDAATALGYEPNSDW